MATELKAVLTRPNHGREIITIDGSLETLQKYVEGYIDIVRLPDVGSLVVNDEGLLQKMEFNHDATRIARAAYGYTAMLIVGPALILGPADAEGDLTSVSDEVIDYFKLGESNAN